MLLINAHTFDTLLNTPYPAIFGYLLISSISSCCLIIDLTTGELVLPAPCIDFCADLDVLVAPLMLGDFKSLSLLIRLLCSCCKFLGSLALVDIDLVYCLLRLVHKG